MRQGSNGRRARGRPHRRQGGSINKNSTFDSNGPEGRVRGNAHQVYEKYISLARDATSSGDRILAESFYQFAEHYFRIVNDSMDPQPGQRKRPDGEENTYDGEDEGDQDADGEGYEQAAEGGQQRQSRRERMNGRHRRQRHDNGENREQPEQRDPGSEPQPSLDLSKSEQPEVGGQEVSQGDEEAPKPRRRGRPRKEETAGQDDSGSDPAAA